MNLNDSFDSNPFLIAATGNLNAKSKKWLDSQGSIIEKSEIEFFNSQFGLSSY